ncbi:hypothetical protein Q3G72_030550 [Acer saccharum]|nr:hypothetical protein Q3G72_030550 [Acer saccharum]
MEEEEEEESKNLEKLLQWAANLGITDSPSSTTNENPCLSSSSCLSHTLTVSNFPENGGRGFSALRDLTKGKLILRIPKPALMTRQRLMEDDHKLSLAVHKHPSLSSTQILSVCLLYEVGKGRSSWWYTYLVNLPRIYDVLAGFGEFDKQALQVDDAIWAAEKAVSKAESEWKEAKILMEELKLKPQLVSFKAWIWASATVSSRTMHIAWDDAGCLCPVGDLFNYAAPGEESNGFGDVEVCAHASSSLPEGDSTDILVSEKTSANLQRLTDGWFEEDVNSYCFYARENYKKGEQVLLSYGTYTNLELLEHYGFLLNENPNDKVFVSLDPGMYSSSSWPKESQYIHGNGKPSFALLSSLRLWATPPHQRRSVGYLAYSGCQLSADNEMSVMKWISNKCNAILKNLPTSIYEDILLLSTINKIQDFNTLNKLEKVSSAFGSEICKFLEANGLQNGKNGGVLSLSVKSKLSIGRWKLAVQWRLRYKRTLVDCISYCEEIISSLSSKNVSTLRTIERKS